MSYGVRNGDSLIQIGREQIEEMLRVLKHGFDGDISLVQNLIECLEQLNWECVEQSQQRFSFVHDLDEPMNWDNLQQMAPFLQDGSFFEEHPGDYVQDLQGNNCPGVMRASIEGSVLRCRLYAVVKGEDGQRSRQLIEEIDPQLI
jgi:hypothetical protein